MFFEKVFGFIIIMFLAAFCQVSEDWVYDAEISVLAKVLVSNSLGHDAGDIPFAIKDNVTWPTTISAGNGHITGTNGNPGKYFISMPKNVDCKELLAILLYAFQNGQKVNIFIKNDDGNSKYPGRPYITAVSIVK